MTDQWLVQKLLEQDKKIEALSRGGTGVGHTSIAPGEALTVISDDGEVVLGPGGVEYVDGPTPATPSAPALKLGFGTIEVTWDGTFAAGEDENGIPLTVPTDLAFIEVHASTDPEEEEWGDDTRKAQVKVKEGFTVTVGGFDVDDEVYVCLIAVSEVPKSSEPSATTSIVIEGLDFSTLFNEIDAANATIKNAGEVLVSEQGTLDEKLTEVDGTLNGLGQDLQAVEDAQAQLDTDLSDVMTSVDGKNTITWNPSAPSAVSNPGKAAGDLWYRTSGNSIIGFWKWDGSNWVTQLLDKTTIPLIDIGAGTFGTLKGARLEAGSVTADRLVVGVSQNLVVDPKFKNATINEARTTKGSSNTWDVVQSGTETWYRNKPGVPLNSKSFYLTTDGVPNNPDTRMAVENTTKWSMSIDVMVEAGSAVRISRMQASLIAYKADGSAQFLAQNFTRPDGSLPVEIGEGWVTLRASFDWSTIPGVVSVAPRVYVTSGGTDGTYYFRNPNISEMVGTTLIENGAVSTQKLTADVLEVKNLKATSGQLDEAVINKLFSDVVVAKTAVAQEFIGENAILTGAVTAPKITASEELWAKIGEFVKIRAEHIEANAIDGMVVTGATFRTSGGSGSWSDAGLFIAQPDGTSMVRFPTDGSPLSLTASDVQIDRATITDLDLSNGAVRSGGTVSLASGVTPPVSPPELTTGWQKFCTLENTGAVDPSQQLPTDRLGLAYWAEGSGHWVRAINVLGSEGDNWDRIETYDYVTGDFQNSFDTGLNPRSGVTVIGDVAYVMGPDYEKANIGKQWVHGINLTTGARVVRWEFVNFFDSRQAKVALGSDGTNLVAAGVAPNRSLYVFRYNPATGAPVGSTWTTAPDWTGGQDIEGVHVNGSEVTILPMQVARVYTASGSTLTRKTDSANTSGFAGWDNPNRNGAGLVWMQNLPWVVDGQGDVYYGVGPASDTTVEACYTWYNGTNETTPSPVATITVPARFAPSASFPVRAGMQKRLYVRTGSGGWARYNIPETRTVQAVAVLTGTNTPPATNTFPASTPAVLKSNVGGFQVKGDGSGTWGPLTFNANGTMSGIPKMAHGTIVLTPPADNTTVTAAVTFPSGMFTQPPSVVVSADTTVPGTNVLGVSTTNITTTSFDAVLRRTNAVASRVYWIAMGV